jgi:hypothetical protein
MQRFSKLSLVIIVMLFAHRSKAQIGGPIDTPFNQPNAYQQDGNQNDNGGQDQDDKDKKCCDGDNDQDDNCGHGGHGDGCTDSPENPTLILGSIAILAYGLFELKRRKHEKTGTNTK